MTIINTVHVKRFFQNGKGDWVIAQPPNVLISLWFLAVLVNIFAFHQSSRGLHILSGMLLFAWAYGELRRGDSPFRRVLGGIILVVTVIMVFV